MNYTNHLLIGFISAVVFIILTHYIFKWFNFSIIQIGIICLIIIVYSLLPDVDHRNSMISFIFIGLGIAGIGGGYYLKNNPIMISSFLLLVLTFLAWIIGHRQLVHSIIFDIIVSLPLAYFLGYQFGLLGFICFYSHMLADGEYFKIW